MNEAVVHMYIALNVNLNYLSLLCSIVDMYIALNSNLNYLSLLCDECAMFCMHYAHMQVKREVDMRELRVSSGGCTCLSISHQLINYGEGCIAKTYSGGAAYKLNF